MMRVRVLALACLHMGMVPVLLALPTRAQAGSEVIELRSGWTYAWVLRDADWDSPPVDPAAWRPLDRLGTTPAPRLARAVWYRTAMPTTMPRDAQLLLSDIDQSFEVRLTDKRVYAFGEPRAREGDLFRGYRWHMVPLPSEAAGQRLDILVNSGHPAYVGIYGRVAVGEGTALVADMWRRDLGSWMLGSTFLIAALAPLGVWLRRRDRRAMGAFALTSAALGGYTVARTESKQWLLDNPWLWRYTEIWSLHAAGLGIGLLAERLLPRPWSRIPGILWRGHLVLAAATLAAEPFVDAAAHAGIGWLRWMLLADAVGLLTASLASARSGDVDGRWISVGLVWLTGFGLYDLAASWGVIAWGPPVTPWGFAGFLSAFAVVIGRRILAELTLRERAERGLRKSEMTWQALRNEYPDDLARVAADGTVLDAKLARPELNAMVLGRKAWDIQTVAGASPPKPEEVARFSALIEQVAKGGAPVSVETSAVVQGRPLEHEVRLVPLGGEVLLIFRDITQRKNQERQLVEAKDAAEAANRAKTAILANVSHELRTPMTAILGFSELMSSRSSDPDSRKHAQLIHRAGTRLLTLLNNIIDLARLEAGQLKLNPVPHEIAETVAHVVELFAVLAEKKGIALRNRVPAGLRTATDPLREEQILSNIISNAVRFTERGSVEVTARAVDGFVEVIVRDTGVGMAPEFLPHAFAEFRQESEGFGRKHEGSGLGLAIARALTERMGGRISLASQKYQGTEVRLHLPMAPAAVARASSEAPIQQVPAARKRVLVVDDDEACAELAVAVLGETHAVTVVANADDALAVFRASPAEVVLVDIHLRQSGMDGLKLLAELRALPGGAAARIVAVTAYAMAGDRDRFVQMGFDGYVAKPFSGDQLVAALSDDS